MENRSLSKQDKQTNEEQQEQDAELDSKQLQEKKEKERERIITQSQNVGELVNEINKITEENDKLLDENKELNKKKDFIAENGYAHDDNINKDLTLKRAIKAHFKHTIKDIKEQLEQQDFENEGRKIGFEQQYLQSFIDNSNKEDKEGKELNKEPEKHYQKEEQQQGMDKNWLQTVIEWLGMIAQERMEQSRTQQGAMNAQLQNQSQKLNEKNKTFQKQKEDEKKNIDDKKKFLEEKNKNNINKAYENEQKKEQIMQRIRELRAQRMQAQQTGDKTKETMLDDEISNNEKQKQEIEQEQQKNKLNISGVGNSNNVYQPTNSTASLQQQNGLGM